MSKIKHVVITGSSSGIGLGLAGEFLKNGYAVTISGRNEQKLNETEKQLQNEFSNERIYAVLCDVSHYDQIKNLWKSAYEKFQRVDIWVNNAGVGQDYDYVNMINEDIINTIIDTNIKGVIHGSRIVYNHMCEQGFGAIYNMEGFGSDGRKMAKLSIYGTTKSAVTYFTKSFIKETKGSDVIIGLISPGMVITDLFLKPVYKDKSEAIRFLKVANILADKVGTVTPWLVKKMIKNTIHGKSFNWLSNTKAMGRFMKSIFKQRTLIQESDINIVQ